MSKDPPPWDPLSIVSYPKALLSIHETTAPNPASFHLITPWERRGCQCYFPRVHPVGNNKVSFTTTGHIRLTYPMDFSCWDSKIKDCFAWCPGSRLRNQSTCVLETCQGVCFSADLFFILFLFALSFPFLLPSVPYKADFELLIFQLLPHKCLGYKYVQPCPTLVFFFEKEAPGCFLKQQLVSIMFGFAGI